MPVRTATVTPAVGTCCKNKSKISGFYSVRNNDALKLALVI